MSYTCLYYHIIFSIKDRQKPLEEEQMRRTREYLAGVIRNMKAKLYICNGPLDHVHMVVSLHPELSLSDFVRTIKTNCSKWFRQTFNNGFSWQDGYSAFTVSYSGIEQVVEYIKNQQEHHRKYTFEEELERFLKKHNIQLERKYL